MTLTFRQSVVLQHVADCRFGVDIRDVSEEMRQRIIDLGMMDPPLVDIEGDNIQVTNQGRLELQKIEARRTSRTIDAFNG